MVQIEQNRQQSWEKPLHTHVADRVGNVIRYLHSAGRTHLDIIDMEHILTAGAQMGEYGSIEYAFAGGVFPDDQEVHRTLAVARLQIALPEGSDIGLYRIGDFEQNPLVKVGSVPNREVQRVFGSHMTTTEVVASERKSVGVQFLPLEFRLAQVQVAGEPMGFEEAAAQFAHPHFSRETYEAISHILREVTPR